MKVESPQIEIYQMSDKTLFIKVSDLKKILKFYQEHYDLFMATDFEHIEPSKKEDLN